MILQPLHSPVDKHFRSAIPFVSSSQHLPTVSPSPWSPSKEYVYYERCCRPSVNDEDKDKTKYRFWTYSLFYKQRIRQWSSLRSLVSHSPWNRHHIPVSLSVYHIPRVNLIWLYRPCNHHQKDISHLECCMGSLHHFHLIIWSFEKINFKVGITLNDDVVSYENISTCSYHNELSVQWNL